MPLIHNGDMRANVSSLYRLKLFFEMRGRCCSGYAQSFWMIYVLY